MRLRIQHVGSVRSHKHIKPSAHLLPTFTVYVDTRMYKVSKRCASYSKCMLILQTTRTHHFHRECAKHKPHTHAQPVPRNPLMDSLTGMTASRRCFEAAVFMWYEGVTCLPALLILNHVEDFSWQSVESFRSLWSHRQLGFTVGDAQVCRFSIRGVIPCECCHGNAAF